MREILSDLPLDLELPELPESPADDRSADDAAAPVRAEMRHIMSRDVGVQRSEDSLRAAERELLRLKSATPRQAWRTANQLLVARLITRAAFERRESIGGHARTDYPGNGGTVETVETVGTVKTVEKTRAGETSRNLADPGSD